MNDDCQTACLAQDFDDCGAYDFDTIMGRCWLYQTAPQSSSLNTAAGFNHYVRVRCTGIIFRFTLVVKQPLKISEIYKRAYQVSPGCRISEGADNNVFQ